MRRAVRVAGAGQEHRQAAEGDSGAAAVADFLPQGEAALEQRPASFEVAAGAGQVAEGVERKGLALLVAELLEAGEALLDQLLRVGEVGLGAIHRGEVDEDVGGGRGAAHAAGDDRGVLVQEERVAGLGLDRDRTRS